MQHIAWLAWLDQDLLTGDGIIQEILPECFVVGDDGLEHVAFGKVVSWDGGPDNLLPVSEELASKLIEAADECPSEALFIELVDESIPPEKYWEAFFTQNFEYVRTQLGQPDETVEALEHALLYAASLIAPDESTTMGIAYGSDMDVLEYMNTKASGDVETRKRVASELVGLTQSHAKDQLGKHQHLLERALSLFDVA